MLILRFGRYIFDTVQQLSTTLFNLGFPPGPNVPNPALSGDLIIPILLDLTLIYVLLCMYLGISGSSYYDLM